MKAIGKIAIKQENFNNNGIGEVKTSEVTISFDQDFCKEEMYPKHGVQLTLPHNIVITASRYVFCQESWRKNGFSVAADLGGAVYEVIIEEEEDEVEVTVNVYETYDDYDDDTPNCKYSTKDNTILAVMQL